MKGVVHIVDDDLSMRTSLYQLVTTRTHMLVRTFRSGDEFLNALPDLERGIVLLDLDMPGMSGVDVLATLRALRPDFMPLIVTGHGDVATTVSAMRLGAFDVIEKPFDIAALLRSLEQAMAKLERDSHLHDSARAARERIDKLSDREREVLLLLVAGHPNKAVARELGVSPRTVEGHRASMMAKLEIARLPEAMRLAYAAGLIPPA
ncbi:response regulator [uncultured Sphingomonas sp.]|uniref:response regulator transcription factor n=1 Tax=uncultured Sphingomonas sp. TaxID=158754 RepID=UPI0025871F31|nr:response regulator [uncultured Sphingomonas sp.]